MKNNDYILRLETEKDYYEVENLAREAFWNLSFLGCSEHLFMHVLRKHPSFIPQLDFVAEQDGKIIGSVMYSESYLEDEKLVDEYDSKFPPKVKAWQPSQEEFYIHSHSVINRD